MLATISLMCKQISNPKHFALLGSFFLLAELAINYFIINFVKCKVVQCARVHNNYDAVMLPVYLRFVCGRY